MSAPTRRHPPRFAEWLLGRRVRPTERHMVLGDLDEQFQTHLQTIGALRATLWYWREAARLSWGFLWWTPRPRLERGRVMAIDDVRYAVRRLWHRPTAAIVSIVTLALAIGAAAATWSLLSAVLLNPLRIPDADRLVQVGFRYTDAELSEQLRSGIRSGYTYPEAQAVLRAQPLPLAAWGTIGGGQPLVVDTATGPKSVSIVFAAHDFLDVLGLRPGLGRFFGEQEDQFGAPLVAVASNRFWRESLASDPGIVGRTIRLGDLQVLIVGIGPPDFRGLEVRGTPDLFMPLHAVDRLRPYDGIYGDRPPISWVQLVGRLPDRADAAQVEARLNGLTIDLRYERTFVLTGVQTASLADSLRTDVQKFMRLLGATVVLLLAISSLTVGMLIMLRTEARTGELAMCLALGASRTRLAAGVALEGVLLASAGVALALPISGMLIGGIRTFELPGSVHVDRLGLSLDSRVIASAMVAGLVSVLLMAVIASFFGTYRASRLGELLRTRAGATPHHRRRHSRAALVSAQVAVTLVLVTGAGLFGRSVMQALTYNPGIDVSRLVSVGLELDDFGYDSATAAAFADDLRVRVLRHPSIEAAGLRYAPRGGAVVVDGRSLEGSVTYASIDLDLLTTIGVRIVQGRGFTLNDSAPSPAVALVTEALGRRIAGGGSPLGRTIVEGWDGGAPATIVGVVSPMRELDEAMVMYRPLAQSPPREIPPNRGLTVGGSLWVRATGDADDAIDAVVSTVRTMDPEVRLGSLRTMEAQILDRMAPQRFGLTVMGALGAIALLLSALGTWVLAESMSSLRRREMGIRAALGAPGRHLRTLMLSETFRLVGAGLGAGLVLCWLGAGTIEAFLYEVEPLDPWVTGGVAATIATLATLVSLRPALAAARVDLARVLRED